MQHPKVNASRRNPSALHREWIGGEACIDHSDKHLTLQEHVLSRLKLLIALNTFSYWGWIVANCFLVGRCCAPIRGTLPSAAAEFPGGRLAKLAKECVPEPESAEGSHQGGRSGFSQCRAMCFAVLSVVPFLTGLATLREVFR